jgi:uncharacterized metal-binding protein
MRERKMTVSCIECGAYRCAHPEVKKSAPKECPRKNYPGVLKQTLEDNRSDPAIRRISMACDEVLERGQDSLGYNWTRVRELIEYARLLGYKKIGVASCIGLIEESKILGRILTGSGFQVVLVSCMAGGTTRLKFGFKERKSVSPPMVCNPLMQAEVLNKEQTELNVMVGLCLGHDILFIKNSKADVTPLIVKDRVTGHNPIAALYTSHTYYKQKLQNPPSPKSRLPLSKKRTGTAQTKS